MKEKEASPSPLWEWQVNEKEVLVLKVKINAVPLTLKEANEFVRKIPPLLRAVGASVDEYVEPAEWSRKNRKRNHREVYKKRKKRWQLL